MISLLFPTRGSGTNCLSEHYVNLCLWATECMSGHVTQLRWHNRWLVTSCVDGMLGGSPSLAVDQQQSWLSSMLSCKTVLLFIVATLRIQTLFSPPLIPLLILLCSLSSDQWWCVVSFRAFWTGCGKVWGPDGGVEVGDFETGKYTGYENLNAFCPSLSPPFVQLQSIRLQTDTSELVNHCRRHTVTRSSETHTTVSQKAGKQPES